MAIPTEGILVMIGLYSGRPNPEMLLPTEDISKFASLITEVVGKEALDPAAPAKLGEFQGFIVLVAKDVAEQERLPKAFSVFRGVLTEEARQPKRSWRDVSGVENYLIDLAFKLGHGELLEKFGLMMAS